MQRFRSERAEKRRKQSFAPTLFDRINGLVKAYALDEAFLSSLDAFNERAREEDLTFDTVRPKPVYEFPLFSMSTQKEYRVTMAVIARVANPYLNFANSPEEILLCQLLFRHNPALPPKRLARSHFEGLLLAEVAKKHIHRLTEQMCSLEGKQDRGTADRSQLSLLQARLERLRAFVTGLEEASGR